MISEYDTLKLKEVTTYISRGITPFYDEKGVRVINQRCVRDKKLNLNDSRVTNPEKRNIPEKKYLRKYDVLVNSTGVGTLGRVAQIKEDLKEPLTADSHVTIIRPDKKIVDGLYFGYALMNAEPHITFLGEGSTGQIELSRKLLASEVEINVPPFEIQKKIAKILNSLDEKIELNQHMNQTLEEIGRAIFKHWFVDFEFPDEQGRPYESSGGEMVDSELGEIPKGWEVGTINDLCSSITNGGTPKRNHEEYWENGRIPWFKTGELFDDPLIDSDEHITENGLKNSSCKLWEPNTILIALYASPTVGRLGILKSYATSNQACSGLVADFNIGYAYLFYTLLFKRTEFNSIAVGSAQQNISQDLVKNSKTVIPPSKLTCKFQKLIGPLFERRTLLKKESINLSKIRDSLLQKLMSGKIRVKN